MDPVTPHHSMDESPEVTALLERIRAGDRGAFELLFSSHRRLLRDLVERRLDPRLAARVDASDVVQETQLEAFDRLDDFLDRRPMPFRLWLVKTALERLQKVSRFHLAAQRRAIQREVEVPDRSSLLLADQLAGSGTSPSQRAQRHELALKIRAALDDMSATDREVVFLRVFEGLSNAEVACLLGIESDAAKKRYARAMVRLKKRLLDEQ